MEEQPKSTDSMPDSSSSSSSSSSLSTDSFFDADSDADSFFDALDFLPSLESDDKHHDPQTAEKSDSTTTTSSSSVTDISTRPTATVPPPPPTPPRAPILLETVVDFLIRAVLFQLSFLFSSITFPIWLLYLSFSILTDPLGNLKRGRDNVLIKLSSIWKRLLDRFVSQNSAVKLIVRVIWGSFWAFYVCSVLIGMLFGAFLGGGLMIGRLVQEPVQIKEDLNFDYTKASPAALVPISSCDFVSGFQEKGGISGSYRRAVPLNHKLQLTVLLNLPESDYNRKLGVFQIRAEFLSKEGKVTSSSSKPCMLRFKSSHMHLIETFIKTGPLLTGYSSESQIINIKMKGLREKSEPAACIRIVLEQRAEYRPGAGIPEIYSASVKLESDLTLFKKILWSWRWTLFVWISSGIFLFELLLVLVFCRPLILPWARYTAPVN